MCVYYIYALFLPPKLCLKFVMVKYRTAAFWSTVLHGLVSVPADFHLIPRLYIETERLMIKY
jgi:hypothetical protein